MPSLDALASIPGYGAYVAKTQLNNQQGINDLQQIGALLQLKNSIQAQQQEQQLRNDPALASGDVEAAMNAALRAGNLAAASKLAPLVEAKRKQGTGQVVAPGGALVGPDGKVIYQAEFKPEKEPAPSSVSRLLSEKAALPEGDPRHKIYDAAIRKETEGAERQPEPLVPTFGPDGKAVYTPRSQAAGKEVPPSSSNRPPPAEIMRMNVALTAMDKALDSYDKLLEEFNPRNPQNLSPARRAKAKSLIAGLQLEWKEAAALGALTGPDLEMMEKAVVDPASAMGAYYGTAGLKNQSQQAREYIKRRQSSIAKYYPNVEGEHARPSAPSSGGWGIREIK